MSASTSNRYPAELRERAVRMVGEIRADHVSDWSAITEVARPLGVGTPETVRKWCRQAGVDAGRRVGVSSEETAELERLKRENAELKRANNPAERVGFLRVNARLMMLGGVRSFLRCPGVGWWPFRRCAAPSGVL